MQKWKLSSKGILIAAVAILAVGILVSIRHAKNSQALYNYLPGRGDTINVAIAYSPMSLYRYEDTLGGLNYEMMKEMAAKYGDAVKFFPVTSVSETLDRLESGRYDIVMADIPVTASLKERFRLSVPVYTDRMVLVSRDTVETTALELAGREVWVVKDSPAAERVANLSREIGDSIHVHTTTDYNAEQLVMLVAAGDIPAAVVNRGVAVKLQPDFPDVRISAHISLSQFQCWFFNRNDTVLADTVDAQIERFRLTPEYASLMVRWMEEE